MQRSLKAKVRECREWLVGAEEMVQWRIEKLQSALREESFDGLVRSTTALSYISMYYGARGVIQLADGGPVREELGLSMLYRFWEIRIRTAAVRKRGFLTSHLRGGGLTNHASIAACTFFALVVLGDRSRATLMAEELRFILDEESKDGGPVSSSRHLERFALFFADGMAAEWMLAKSYASGATQFGIYNEIVSNWSASVIEKSLPIILKYHYDNCEDDGAGVIPAFKWYPFDAIPFEAIAIAGHGDQLDQKVSSVDPLLEHMTLELRGGGGITSDATIDAVETAFSEIFTRD